ncbi:hypothetical protein [Sanguibacter antarcticus]|uniref:Uncharacterized protein n=1 Tax=Sanguibacter antarcticus TaxID=372484 RepID=A0A2A9E471_9MICO|nr:hypothetical protein [Sanguibacter antarcticus]PFG33436.1 hypothetical protein ATL42_1312 [Sanguibacter antarcticus]
MPVLEPYPAAPRPSFDVPAFAPVSVHTPVVLQRVSTPVGVPHAVDSENTTARHAGGDAAHGSTDRSLPGSHTSAHTYRAPRSRGAAIIVLSFALALAVGVGTYLAILSNQWEARSSEWEAQSRDLGGEVADLTGDVAGMTSELSIVRDQLATAQTRITELADEKAQVGDDRESQKILANDVQEVAQTALNVSASLGDCVTAQNTVMGYLAAPDTTTPEIIQTAATQADTVCAAAVDDYNSLQRDLSAS